MFSVLVFLILFSTNFYELNGYKNKSVAHRLYQNLIFDQEYNKNVRPVVNVSEQTVVSLSLYLLTIVEFNEITEKLSITGKLKLSWIDEYLSWNPLQYEGLESINLPQNEVWKPDIALENSITKYRDLGTSSMNVHVHSDGHVVWKPMEVFHATCSADVTRYPNDKQNCCLSFESWTYSRTNVQITNGSKNVILHHGYDGQPQWLITDTSSETTSKSDDFYVNFCIKLERQSMYVMLNIILPIAFLSLLNTCVFILPASCGEKASFTVTVFLAVGVFLTIVSEQLPKSSDKVSLFNLYVFFQVMLSTIVTVTTLIQIRLYHRDNDCNIPGWIQSLFVSCLSMKQNVQIHAENNDKTCPDRALCELEKPIGIDTPSAIQSDEIKDRVTWKFIASVLDTVMFIFFSSSNVIFSLGLLAWSICKQ